MTRDEETVMLIRGQISILPKNKQEKIVKYYEEIRIQLEKEPTLLLVIALIGAEISAAE